MLRKISLKLSPMIVCVILMLIQKSPQSEVIEEFEVVIWNPLILRLFDKESWMKIKFFYILLCVIIKIVQKSPQSEVIEVFEVVIWNHLILRLFDKES